MSIIRVTGDGIVSCVTPGNQTGHTMLLSAIVTMVSVMYWWLGQMSMCNYGLSTGNQQSNVQAGASPSCVFI